MTTRRTRKLLLLSSLTPSLLVVACLVGGLALLRIEPSSSPLFDLPLGAQRVSAAVTYSPNCFARVPCHRPTGSTKFFVIWLITQRQIPEGGVVTGDKLVLLPVGSK